MGKKRRHAAKTGDQALKRNQQRQEEEQRQKQRISQKQSSSYDENMYNEIDQFHLNREKKDQEQFIRLDASNQDLDSDDGSNHETSSPSKKASYGVEGVMDLGLPGSDDDDSDDSDSDSDDSSNGDKDEEMPDNSDDSSAASFSSSNSSSSDENDKDELDKHTAIMKWGKRSKDYYHGDTADLEIGQDFDDAKVEEEAGREIQQLRYERMDDEDFMPFSLSSSTSTTTNHEAKQKNKKDNGMEEEEEEAATTNHDQFMLLHRRNKIQKLKPSEKRVLLENEHPEYFPIVNYFTDRFVRELKDKIMIVSQQLLSDQNQAETIGTNRQGMEYLYQKQMLLMSTTLNLCTYLLFKIDAIKKENSYRMTNSSNNSHKSVPNENEQFLFSDLQNNHSMMTMMNDIKNHPIISRLNTFSKLADEMEKKIEEPLGLKEQLNSLVQAVQLMHQEGLDDEDDENDNDSLDVHNEDEEIKHKDDTDENHDSNKNRAMKDDIMKEALVVSDDDNNYDDEDSSSDNEEKIQQTLINDARFGVRPDDFESKSNLGHPSISDTYISPLDFGDDEDDNDAADIEVRRKAEMKLASTMNTIAQKEKGSKKILSNSADNVDLDNLDQEVGNGGRRDFTKDEDIQEFERGLQMMEEDLGYSSNEGEKEEDDNFDNELDGITDKDDALYKLMKEKSARKKTLKKNMYAVAPKYPTLDTEIEGERAIGNRIMKNRGLVPHKSKMNRNPRVKKREQYRKALIRRRGAVREVRTGEADNYGGELTGIKTGVSHSRKLGVQK